MPDADRTVNWWARTSPGLAWWRPLPAAESSPARDEEDLAARPEMRESRLAFWGVMAFTFVLLISPQSIVPALAPLRLAFVSAGGSIVALVADRFGRRQPLLVMTGEMWIAAALAAWAVVTVPWSYWPGGSASFLLQVYFKALTIFWLLANALNTLGRIRGLVQALTVMSVPLALTGLRHFLAGQYFKQSGRIEGYAGALTENPNDLALMLNLLLPLAVALLLITRRPLARLALAAAIILDVAGVFATYSRGGFVTLGILFLVYLWKFHGRPERRWVWGLVLGLFVVMLVGLPLLPASYVERLGTIVDIKADRTGSAEARWEDTFAALDLVSGHPIIGAGAGQNILALNQERGKRWTAIHNVYLEYAVDLGLPGLGLFLALLGLCLRSTALVQRETAGRPASRDLFCLAEGVQVSLIAFAVAGMFHPVAYHFYFYYMAGLALAVLGAWHRQQGAPLRTPLPSAAVSR